ncbi:MaoC family dehydratase [Streptomyces sp. NBC_01381]|uniref:MaoC family dehydratase n=1 Tax=Streptomyces sp. NBC_01381 TaxID=2903845 RepID=UPI002252D9EB|nr:MaoC family dehydratase [Streptomyces sp. NBC_01381]MCX4665273.1 MaoC family dehydratase [Streptomyces sp. NBC_01381]
MLAPQLLRGALLSPFKRPRPDAPLDTTPRTRPAARPDPRHLTTYANLCGYDDAHDAALPLTYPHILGFPLAMGIMTARTFPLPLLGLVHTSIEIAQERPLSPTEELEIGVHAAELSPHRRGTEATVVTEARATDGTAVWTSTSTYLARHKTSNTNTTPQATGGAPADTTPLPARAEWQLPPDLGRRYGAATGDRNPIHLYALTARALGFPRAIAHGMWTFARCLAERQTDTHPRRIHAEFKAPVLLPSTVIYAAEGPAFELRSPTGAVHLTGTG